MSIVMILLIIAFVLALLAAFGVATPVGLFPLAFALFVLAEIVGRWHV